MVSSNHGSSNRPQIFQFGIVSKPFCSKPFSLDSSVESNFDTEHWNLLHRWGKIVDFKRWRSRWFMWWRSSGNEGMDSQIPEGGGRWQRTRKNSDGQTRRQCRSQWVVKVVHSSQVHYFLVFFDVTLVITLKSVRFRKLFWIHASREIIRLEMLGAYHWTLRWLILRTLRFHEIDPSVSTFLRFRVIIAIKRYGMH